MALAKGADKAIRIDTSEFSELDGFGIAQLISLAVKKMSFDIIFTGCIATDDGCSQVGPMIAELLGIPHATLVTEINIENSKAKVKRELEGGLFEIIEIKLPVLFSIQTGINEPRYASLIAIRKASLKEIALLKYKDLGAEILPPRTKLDKLFVPPIEKRAEILEGSAEEVSTKLATIIKGKGLI
jgi:electron transfer flavoprotein beta subunit